MADKITLSDLKDEIAKGNKSQSNTTAAILMLNSTFVKQFKLDARGAGDRLEDKLEGPKGPKVVKKEMTGFKPLDSASGNINAFFGRLANIGKMIAGFAAGLAAVGAAFAGMRGWELPIIKRISNIKFGNLFPESLAKTLNQKFLNVRARVLRFFSMSAVLPKGGDGKQITTIGGQIANAFKNAKTSILKGFGIGIDGKLIALQGEDGKFKSPRIGRFLLQMKSLFSPITKVGAAIGEFFTSGFGAKIVTFMKGGATKLLGVFGKILWPIGVLVSAFKGVKDFIDTEGTIYDKFTAGISTALSDFVGAPLNLLKDLMAWGLKKLGFDEGAEWLKGIDFVKPIKDMITTVMQWFGTLFSDPVEALKIAALGALNLLVAGATCLADIIMAPIKLAMDWIGGLFSWTKPGEEGIFTSISSIAFSAWASATNWLIGLFTWDEPAKALINLAYMPLNLALKVFTGIGSWIAGLFGFDKTSEALAEANKYSVGDIAIMAFDTVKKWLSNKFSGEVNLGGLSFSLQDIVTALGDNIGLMKDILVSQISFSIKRLVNGFKSSFERAANFIANLGDELYLMISKNFRFKLPEINIPETFLTPAFNLIPAINVGVGDAASRTAAKNRIQTRDNASTARVSKLQSETGNELANLQSLQAQLASNLQAVVVNNNTTNTANNNSSSANSTNLNGTASAGDPFALMPSAF